MDLTAQGVRVTFVDQIAFASGSAQLDGPAQDVLMTVAELATTAEGVEVEGHTDDRPIATGAYPSNWELSAARAAAVVRFLTDQPGALAPDAYAAVGYGQHRPRTDNDTPESRARNRRISVLFRTPDPNAPSTPAFPDRCPLTPTPSRAARGLLPVLTLLVGGGGAFGALQTQQGRAILGLVPAASPGRSPRRRPSSSASSSSSTPSWSTHAARRAGAT